MPNTKPTTPLHPDANQEIEAPKEIPKELTSALDLEEDDEDDLSLDLVNTQSHNNDYLMDSDDSDGQDGAVNESEVQKDDSLIDAVAPIGEPISPRASRTNTGNDSVSTNFFDMDFESRRTPLNPFGQNTKMSSSEPIRILRKSSGENKIRKLSMSQQSRLISYIDERLMAIQRKFIKYLSAREDPETKTEDKSVQYGLSELMHSLDSVINIIWYSMFKMRFVPFVYHDDVLTEDEREKLGLSNSKQIELEEITSDFLFGQTSYLIRIMGDLVDYTSKFHFQSFQEVHNLIYILAELDNIICILIDEYEDSDDGDLLLQKKDYRDEKNSPVSSPERSFISNTEKIRIDSIISRTKLLVITKFDEFKKIVLEQLNDNDDDNATHIRKRKRDDQIRIQIQKFEILIGEIYEGILDRTSV